MPHLYMAVPPGRGDATTPVETGVYLRMGTYVDDTAHPVDEYSQMPASFQALNTTASASEGIFITSSGTYIVIAKDEGHIDIEGGATQALTGDDGSMTTTVKQDSVSMAIKNGAFELEGHSFFNVTSESGDISVSAKKGKVSSKGNYVFTHTYGAYIKIAHANKKSGTHGADTNVSVSLNMSFYSSVLFSAKLCTISVKIASASATLVTISAGMFSVDFNMTARAIVAEDTKYALLYIKYRGIQLESDSKKNSATGLIDKRTGLVTLSKGIASAKMSPYKLAFGLVSNIPGV